MTRMVFRAKLVSAVSVAALAAFTTVWAAALLPDEAEQAALAHLRGKIAGRIVWESNRTDAWQLYIMNADGSGVRRLTSDEGDHTGARFSPDGRWILYTLAVPGRLPQVWVMQADGTGAKLLVDNAADADWRRGGEAIQFLRRPDPTQEFWETWEYSLVTGEERRLFPHDGAAFQPGIWSGLGNDEGTRFVIWAPNPRGTWVVSPDGAFQKHVHDGCEGQVAADQRYGYGVFSHDGHFVRFNLSDGGDMRDITRLSGPWSHVAFPRVPAKASWLVYGACPLDQHDTSLSNYEIFIVPLVEWQASGQPVRLTFNDRTDRMPDLWLSPDEENNQPLEGPYDTATGGAVEAAP